MKDTDYTMALQDWLDKNPTAFRFRAAAENVLQDLQNALGWQGQYIGSYIIEKMASFSTVLSETVSLANPYWHYQKRHRWLCCSLRLEKRLEKIFINGDIERKKFKHVEDGMKLSLDDELR